MVGKGTATQTFYVHEELAAQHSEFVSAALRNNWKERKKRVIKLPEEDANLFAIFADFIYSGCVRSMRDDDKRNETKDSEWRRLGRCWILADKLMSDSLKDAVVDTIAEKIGRENMAPIGMHTNIYPIAVGSSGIKRLLVDIATWGWEQDTLKARQIDVTNMEFLRSWRCD